MAQKRAREYGLTVGKLPTGPRNKITDVPGILVGHATVANDDHNTGVTVVIPGAANPFTHKLPAGVVQFNGFGKTTGLMQIGELGTLETPIALTSTLNVGIIHDAMVEHMLTRCKAEEVSIESVNPVVGECNDANLNRSTHRAVSTADFFAALDDAKADFLEGSVGAGRGTMCHGLKGGIGSASRVVRLDDVDHGILSDLTVCGQHIGPQLAQQVEGLTSDQGSIIVVIATDLPLDARQLVRVARRASVGLARLGSYVGHGSGEVFLAFSTANPFPVREKVAVRTATILHENKIDEAFRAVAECTEEAVLNSMLTSPSVTGPTGRLAAGLTELWTPTMP